MFFKRSWWPHGEVLGQLPDRAGWHATNGSPTAVQRSDVLVFRWEAPLFFANAGMFRQQVRQLVRENDPQWVVLQCEAITDIDVTAAGVLRQLDVELNEQGVHVAFVELRSRLQDLVYRYGLFDTLDRDHFYGSIEEALAEIDAERASDATGRIDPP
jgi:MFS superfamily sulfate permease-like transporter